MSRVFDECKAVLDKGASFRSPHFVLTEHTLVNESTVWVGECVFVLSVAPGFSLLGLIPTRFYCMM